MAASKSKKTSPKNTVANVEPTARHFWLASLGALVAVRRESKAAVKRASIKVENTIADTRYALRRAEAELRSSAHDVRTQVQPKVQKFSRDVEARLAPIVDKLGLDTFGLKGKTKRAPRKGSKPTAKKPTLRRATRKPAKRAAGKVAG